MVIQECSPEIQEIINNSFSETLNAISNIVGIYYSVVYKNGDVIARNKDFERDYPEILNAKDASKSAWKQCEKVIKTGRKIIVEEEHNGKFFTSIKQPIYHKGKCVAVAVVSHDITEQKRLELMQRKFIESISHDIRTPFTGLYSLSSFMESQEKDLEKKECLEIISKCSKRLMDYLEKIIDTTRSSDNLYLYETTFNIKEELYAFVEMCKAQILLKNIDVKINCPDIEILQDRFKFEQIILNVISNAVKFTENGFVNINSYLTDDEVLISVEDSGVGIPEEHIGLIFDKFYRVIPSELESDYKGCGLGLHIAKTLTESIGGKISVISEVNKGSTFLIRIPL